MSQVPMEFRDKKSIQYHFYTKDLIVKHLDSGEFEAILIECVRPCALGQIALNRIRAASIHIDGREYLIIRNNN